MDESLDPDNEETSDCCDDESDLHICGTCKQQFSSIDYFLRHKQQKCCLSTQDMAVEFPPSLGLNMSFGLEGTDQHEEHVADLRASLLGLAAAAEIELLDLAEHERNQTLQSLEKNESFRGLKDDEEDVADVLANQLSGIIAPVLNIDTSTVENAGIIVDDVEHVIVTSKEKSIKSTTKIKATRKLKKLKEKPVKNVQAKATFKCPEDGCTYTGRYSKDLTRHLRIHTGERPFSCTFCDKTFSRADKLKSHERTHSGIKPYKCDMCLYAAVDPVSLRKHIRTHTDERPCKCQLCPYRARDSSQLVVHLRKHTGDNPFMCLAPGCKWAFKTSSDLKRHTRLHTNEQPFVCDLCNHRTRIKSNLLAHMRRLHLEKPKIHKCPFCNDFEAPTAKQLREHKKIHNGTLLHCCVQQCSYTSEKSVALRYHMRSKHPEKCPELSCEHCSFTSLKVGVLRQHKKTKHSINQQEQKILKREKIHGVKFLKRFVCSICNASFVREDSMRSHVRVHDKARSGMRGVVVVDQLAAQQVSPDSPEPLRLDSCEDHTQGQRSVSPLEVSIINNSSETCDEPSEASQSMVFYVSSANDTDSLLLSPSNALMEQLSIMQPNVQYILMPSSPEGLNNTNSTVHILPD